MEFYQEQTHTVTQQTALHTALEARQLHSLEFLAAPIMELEQKIAAEIQMNPVLEAIEPDIYASGSDLPERPPADETDYDENRDDLQDSLDKMLTAENYEQMVEIAEKLSAPFPHVRVDFYNIDGTIIFGELTFFTNSGPTLYEPEEFELELGKQFVLPERNH